MARHFQMRRLKSPALPGSFGMLLFIPVQPLPKSTRSIGSPGVHSRTSDLFIFLISVAPFDSCVGERLILFFDRFRRRALNKFTLFFFDKEVADVTSNDF